ncbi:hemoglobin-like flavoprotein [Xenococcus sp. PCC 7305]|uniref:globin family protein n=1 Tax=Xenococcus sp. PCC 7305 TaxID=102125 RepID=UPI0002AC3909|nr:globin family protein [Xenococcus sp. PCC 7305]ELS02073.1 hemoglobin-like flavoprotein [Xenococcus sp. PCC 7305]
MSLQVELLEQSFKYIKPYGTEFISEFYENLFESHPEIQFLLAKIDPETSQHQLWHDLVFVIENLRQPPILENTFQGFGARLFTYGILPEHYPMAKNSLFNTFEQFLGDGWTAEFAEAWNIAYINFRKLMLDGAEQTRKQMTDINSIPKLDETFQEETIEFESSDDSLTTEELLPTPIPAFSDNSEADNMAVENPDYSAIEELLPTPIPAFSDNIEEQVEVVTTADNAPLEEFLAAPIPELADNLESDKDDPLAEFLDTPIPELEENLAAEIMSVETAHESAREELLVNPISELTDNPEVDDINDIVNTVTSDKDDPLAEFLDASIPELEENLEEKVEFAATTDNDPLKDLLDNAPPELEDNLAEQVSVANSNNYLPEEFLPTIVSDLEGDSEPEVGMIANADDFPTQDIQETPILELEENRLSEEVDVIPSIDDSLVEEALADSLSESVNIVEEQVIIVENTEDSPEKLTLETTMSESDKSNQNIPEEDNKLNQAEESLADLSEKLKSASVEPHFTQIFSPESQSQSQSESTSTATATATATRPVAGEEQYQPESQTSQSKKGLLIGGGVAGAIGVLLLLLL